MATPIGEMTQSTTATIAAAGSLSAAINMGGRKLAGIVMPAAWDAAAITLQGSIDGTTFGDVYIQAGTEYSITTAASRVVVLDAELLRGISHLKVRSGTAGTPVAQAAERVLTLLCVAL